jgi:hypothetical protein
MVHRLGPAGVCPYLVALVSLLAKSQLAISQSSLSR